MTSEELMNQIHAKANNVLRGAIDKAHPELRAALDRILAELYSTVKGRSIHPSTINGNRGSELYKAAIIVVSAHILYSEWTEEKIDAAKKTLVDLIEKTIVDKMMRDDS